MAQNGPWGGGSGDGPDDDDKTGSGKRPRPAAVPPAQQPPGQQPPAQPPRPWGAPPRPGDQRPGAPGPQGQGPRRPDQMPEFDDLLRKGQERLRVIMGGGQGGPGGPRRGGGPGDGLPHLGRGSWGFVALGALAVWLFASVYTVNTEEKSVELLFGRPYAIGTEGLNFAPWPMVTYEKVQVTGERVTEIGTGRDVADSGLMLTRDQNIVDMEYQVVWNISDPEKFLFNLADPDATVRAVAESAMRDIVARSELAPILNRDRGSIAAETRTLIQQTLDLYQSGINVVRVNLDRADPPKDVIDSFRQVQAAQQERDRLEKEADAYANRVLANARGQAASLVQQAEAYRAEAVNTAEGDAARFTSIQHEYAKAPELTRQRMYLETMEKVLGGVNKIVLDPAAQGVVPYLPLDRLTPQKPTASRGPTTDPTTGLTTLPDAKPEGN